MQPPSRSTHVPGGLALCPPTSMSVRPGPSRGGLFKSPEHLYDTSVPPRRGEIGYSAHCVSLIEAGRCTCEGCAGLLQDGRCGACGCLHHVQVHGGDRYPAWTFDLGCPQARAQLAAQTRQQEADGRKRRRAESVGDPQQ